MTFSLTSSAASGPAIADVTDGPASEQRTEYPSLATWSDQGLAQTLVLHDDCSLRVTVPGVASANDRRAKVDDLIHFTAPETDGQRKMQHRARLHLIRQSTTDELLEMPAAVLVTDVVAAGAFWKKLSKDGQRPELFQAWCDSQDARGNARDVFSLGLLLSVSRGAHANVSELLTQLRRPAFEHIDAAAVLAVAARAFPCDGAPLELRKTWNEACAGLLVDRRLSTKEHHRLTSMLDSAV